MTTPATPPKPMMAQLPLNGEKFLGFSDTAKELFDSYEAVVKEPPPITATAIAGFGVGAPPVTEIAASGIAAWHLDTTDQLIWPVRIPRNADLSKEILVRLLCSQNQALATGSYIFAFLHNLVKVGTTVRILPATAFDFNPPSQVDLAADIPVYTGFAVISPNKAGVMALEPGKDVIDIMATAALTGCTSIDVLALEVFFRRMMV